MNEPVVPAKPGMLRVLIATQSAHTGAALASLLGDPCDISYEIVGLSSVLPVNLFRAQPRDVDVVLLDLEPWPDKALGTALDTAGDVQPPLVLALAHGVEESMRRKCRDAGVDHLLDRTADLACLQNVIAEFLRSRCAKTRQGQVVP